jgi:hypothetical protein
MSALLLNETGWFLRLAYRAIRPGWYCAVICGLQGVSGCAEIASGPTGTYLDAAGHPSAAAEDAAKLRVSCGEAVNLSSWNFGALEFTFENPTESWQRVEQVRPDFGGEKVNQAVSIRGGGRSRSGRGVEWQGWREGPQGEQVSQLVGSVKQALGAGVEGVDKGSVPSAKVECGPFVSGVDKGRGAAVGGGRAAVRVLVQNGGHAHGSRPLALFSAKCGW